jgi:hypothetical protein
MCFVLNGLFPCGESILLKSSAQAARLPSCNGTPPACFQNRCAAFGMSSPSLDNQPDDVPFARTVVNLANQPSSAFITDISYSSNLCVFFAVTLCSLRLNPVRYFCSSRCASFLQRNVFTFC